MNAYRARQIAELTQAMNEIDADICAVEDAIECGGHGSWGALEFAAARKRLAKLTEEWRYVSDCCDELRSRAA
jgi:hypothetical protein